MEPRLQDTSLPSTVHNFRPQISVYNHCRRHFTPTILIHCLRKCAHEWGKNESKDRHRLFTWRVCSFISNEDQMKRTETKRVSTEVKTGRWKRTAHVLRMERNSHCRTALIWPPEGKHRRGRPRTTWYRSLEHERWGMEIVSWKVARNMEENWLEKAYSGPMRLIGSRRWEKEGYLHKVYQSLFITSCYLTRTTTITPMIAGSNEI